MMDSLSVLEKFVAAYYDGNRSALARDLGVNHDAPWRWLSGRSRPRYKAADSLAALMIAKGHIRASQKDAFIGGLFIAKPIKGSL